MEAETGLVLLAIVCLFGHVLTIWMQMGFKIQIDSSVNDVDEGIHERIDALDQNLGQIIGVIFERMENMGTPAGDNPLLSILNHFITQQTPNSDYNRDALGQFNGPQEIIEATHAQNDSSLN